MSLDRAVRRFNAHERAGGTMAQSFKYGKLDIPGIGDNEPVFILRAQDELAEGAIGMYRDAANAEGSSIIEKIDEAIMAFHDWPGKRKLPD